MAMEEVLSAKKDEYFLIITARKLVQLNNLNENDFKELIWLNELRNKIYHRATHHLYKKRVKRKDITYIILKS